jgi:predicted negative regulator of RcsB-dependent stress response
VYTTEDEDLERIKRWWAAYGRWVTLIVLVGVLGFGSWKGWGYYRTHQAQQASAIYAALQQAAKSDDAKGIDQAAKQLIDGYANTPYAALAQLILAKRAVEAGKLDAAAADLQWVADHGSQQSLQRIAVLRLAQVRIAQKKPDAALSLLKTGFAEAYMPLVKEVEGDAWEVKGNAQRARAAYEQALAGAQIAGLPVDGLKMKIAALAAAAQGKA